MQSNPASFVGIAAMMFVVGVSIPLMAALNGGLGRQIESPYAATFLLFCFGLVLSFGLMMANGGFPAIEKFRGIPPYFYLGALVVVSYIASITWAGPRIGVGNAVFFVLLGQVVAAATVDHFGLLSAAQAIVTPRRLMGVAVMALGIYLARKPV
ncbi:DMT family transporter [Novosphingobium sp. JCM 18896]|uniref:DMT family transporter n=1 Tax=Novosphingobium sp. JCM 18896 TaxID=2989731 RepID=UPI0022225E3A|nr:DMT family transporter [Novosphingobium sp. JCM 18896]MCW1428600.1 DMT family transporter [Novosphingobium sp. JCM 18896]